MKILVTGAGGFIGSHLAEFLVEKGHEVTAFVRYNSKNNWGWLEESEYKDDMEIYCGDLRDYDSVYDAVRKCEAIFHLGALIGIPYSYVSPLAYVKTNVEGTYNVLEAARKSGVDRVIHTSTSETYGTAQFVPISEKHPVNPQSPYAASKAGADHMALSYYKSFGLPVTVIRPFNTYGPRQSSRAIIPTVISQIASGKKTIKLGNLSPTRDLNYVSDTVNGFYEVGLHARTIGDTFNIGNGKEISMGDLVRKITEIMGREVEIATDSSRLRPEKSEVERLLSDPSKAMELTGWKPRVSLSEGLKLTAKWIVKSIESFKTDIYNV